MGEPRADPASDTAWLTFVDVILIPNLEIWHDCRNNNSRGDFIAGRASE